MESFVDIQSTTLIQRYAYSETVNLVGVILLHKTFHKGYYWALMF